jgi:hypothetical protein
MSIIIAPSCYGKTFAAKCGCGFIDGDELIEWPEGRFWEQKSFDSEAFYRPIIERFLSMNETVAICLPLDIKIDFPYDALTIHTDQLVANWAARSARPDVVGMLPKWDDVLRDHVHHENHVVPNARQVIHIKDNREHHREAVLLARAYGRSLGLGRLRAGCAPLDITSVLKKRKKGD